MRTAFEADARPARILLGRVDTLANPTDGAPMRRNTGEVFPETMPAYIHFRASETVRAPRAYVVLPGLWQDAIASLLDAHGVRYERASAGSVQGQGAHEAFRIDSTVVADQPNQGILRQETFGRWEAVPGSSAPLGPTGSFLVVPVDQPLGRLAAVLLEPRSDDGVAAWALVPASALRAGGTAPILRIP